MKKYDVIVIGAGAVGLVSALSLAKHGLRIVVMDSQIPETKWDASQFALRVSAISPGTQQILSDLGAWSEINDLGYSPFEKMRVWDSGGDGAIEFDCANYGTTHLGSIIENRVLIKALYTQLQQKPNIDFLAPIHLQAIQQPQLTTDQGEFSAPLIIGADGANSWLRKQIKFPVKESPYGHHAIVATVKTARDHQATAWQRFLPTGPLAFLPLFKTGDHTHSSIVWSVTPTFADELMALSDSEFKERLRDSFDARLGDIETVSQRVKFPLTMRHAKHYVAQGLALVGDAAHTIHPLAGQGVNMGIIDAVVLADVVANALEKKRCYYSEAVLRRYERRRKIDNQIMMSAVDGLKQLFAHQQPWIKAARNWGLLGVNRCSPIKALFAAKAMGVTR